MVEPIQPQVAKHFWDTLRAQSDRLREEAFAGQIRAAHAQVRQLLQECGISLVMEMTSEGDNLVLLFTPEWSFGRARIIDSFIALAPELPGWRVFGRRQRRNWETALLLLQAAFGVGAPDARFTAEEIEEALFVTMYSTAHDSIEPEFHETFVFYLLSHALGEEVLFNKIAAAGLCTPAADVPTLSREEFTALVDARAPNNW